MMSKTLKKKDLDMLSGISKGSKSKKGLLSSAKLQTKLQKKDAPTNTSVHTKDLVAKLKEYRELQQKIQLLENEVGPDPENGEEEPLEEAEDLEKLCEEYNVEPVFDQKSVAETETSQAIIC